MRWVGYVAAALIVTVLVGVLRLASVDAAGIAAPLLLLSVVIVARFWGTAPALIAATTAAGFLSVLLPLAGRPRNQRPERLD